MKRFNILHFLTMLMVMTLTISSCSKDEEAEDKTETGTESGKGKEEELTLSSISLDNIKMNQNYTIQITSGSGSYSVESSDTEVVSVEINGKTLVFYTHKAGTATITVTDKESGQSVSFDVTVKDGTETGTGIHTDTTPEGLEAVDLGLPSGTLWANMNVGATKPEEYGGYYAWGETVEKNYYTEDNYAYIEDGEYVNIGAGIAGTEYDVAFVKWGINWRMPTMVEIRELFKYTTRTREQINGVKGMRFTATNGNSIFLPAAGFRSADLYDAGYFGNYWSSTQYPDYYAYYLGFNYLDNKRWYDDGNFRYHGQSVRPVHIFNGGSLIIDVDSPEDETIHLCPDNKHPHMIDLGLLSGTKWSCCNIDATSPTDYGGYYGWGETSEESGDYKYWEDENGNGRINKYELKDIGSDIAGTSYDVAHIKWGGSWRMPSKEQFGELLFNSKTKWISINGVNGRLFTGQNGNKIFFPAAGWRSWGTLYGEGGGWYWSSTQAPYTSGLDAYNFHFSSNDAFRSHMQRYLDQSVRPVSY